MRISKVWGRNPFFISRRFKKNINQAVNTAIVKETPKRIGGQSLKSFEAAELRLFEICPADLEKSATVGNYKAMLPTDPGATAQVHRYH